MTYADPYASDSDDDGTGPSTRACLLDKLQPRLLFPSVGKPSISSGAQQHALRKGVAAFGGGEMKKMGGMRPSLEMMAERQQARSSGQHRSKFSSSSSSSSSAHVDLMTSKIGHSSSWSDEDDDEEEVEEEADFDEEDEDEEEEEEDEVQVSASLYGNEEGCKGASATFPLRVAHEDDDYDDDDDQEMTEEQDDNPFMERTIVSRQQGNTRNATFVDRLYRAQHIASLNRQSTTASGVVRSSSRNDMNRYNPYNKQQSQIHYRSHATSQR